MQTNPAIERNHAILLRVLSLIMVYIGLADDTPQAMRFITKTASPADAFSGGDRGYTAPQRAFAALSQPSTFSRRLHAMVRKLLLPAESATRRLIIVLAASLPDPKLRPSELARYQPKPVDPTAGPGPGMIYVLGAGYVKMPKPTWEPGVMVPPHLLAPAKPPKPDYTPPLFMPRFCLVDPLKRFGRRHRPKLKVEPRISFFDGPRRPLPVKLPPTPYDQLPILPMLRRVAALAAALDDLPKQAHRFARWRSIRDVRSAIIGAEISGSGKPGQARRRMRGFRLTPLRGGYPPGSPPRRLPRDKHSEEHGVLAETHSMALYALAHPDTS